MTARRPGRGKLISRIAEGLGAEQRYPAWNRMSLEAYGISTPESRRCEFGLDKVEKMLSAYFAKLRT